MSKYKKFYFVHAMKNGGRSFRENVIFPLYNKLEKNGIEVIIPTINENIHTGWHSKVNDDTYVVCLLRDPAAQAVSLFCHHKILDRHGRLKEKYDKSVLNKENLFEDLKSNIYYKNIQSCSLLYNEKTVQDFYANPKPFDYSLFIKRKNMVSLFLKQENLKGNYLNIQEKIVKDLKLNINTVYTEEKDFYNFESKILFDSLSEKEKNDIRLFNSIDNSFYKNSNFWNKDDGGKL